MLGGYDTHRGTTIVDLLSDPAVERVICADRDFGPLAKNANHCRNAKNQLTQRHCTRTHVLSAINHKVFYLRGGKRVFYLCPLVGLSATMGIQI